MRRPVFLRKTYSAGLHAHIQLKQKDLQPDVLDRMKNFAENPSTDSIIIAVTIEGSDKRSLGQVMQLFNSAVSGTLKNTTYLERNDA